MWLSPWGEVWSGVSEEVNGVRFGQVCLGKSMGCGMVRYVWVSPWVEVWSGVSG